MKKILNSLPLYSALFCFIILMSGYSVDYSRVDSRDDKPRVSKKEQRRNLRMEKRKVRLEKWLSKTKSLEKRQKIQKKIRMISQKQNNENPVFGITGMVLSIVAALMAVSLLVVGFLVAISVIPVIALQVWLFLFLAVAVLALVGLGISIAGFVLSKKNPDKYSGGGLALAGMIIGSILFAIALAFFISFL